MAKVKYIIILTLILVIGLLFLQLQNHKQLTNDLVYENNYLDKDHKSLINQIKQLEEKISNLENKITTLENNNTNLQDNINQLQDDIILMEEDINNKHLIPNDINYTIKINDNIYKMPPTFESNETNISEDDLKIIPKIQLDDENNIESINIEYKENF